MENLLGWTIVVIAIVAPILIVVGFYKWHKGAKAREASAIAKADKEAIAEQRKLIAARKEVVQHYANYTPALKPRSSYTSTATPPVTSTVQNNQSSGLDTSDVILGAMLVNSWLNSDSSASETSRNSDVSDLYSGSTFSSPSSDSRSDSSSDSSGPSFSMPDGSWSSSDSSSDSSSSWSSDSGSSSSDW